MPAQITHYLHGKKVLANIKALKLSKTEIDLPAFFMGTQGPDFFFTHRYFPFMTGESISKYGGIIHRANPVETILFMKNFVDKKDELLLYSYFYGFLCHYSMDSVCHPYIDSTAKRLADDMQDKDIMHAEIESAIDFMLNNREIQSFYNGMSYKALMPTNNRLRLLLCDLYFELIKKITDLEISKKLIMQTFSDCRFVFSTLQDRTGIKRRMLDKIEKGKPHKLSSHILPIKIDNIDYLNEANREWEKGGETSKASFFELFDLSINRALRLISRYNVLDEKEFILITENESF